MGKMHICHVRFPLTVCCSFVAATWTVLASRLAATSVMPSQLGSHPCPRLAKRDKKGRIGQMGLVV